MTYIIRYLRVGGCDTWNVMVESEFDVCHHVTCFNASTVELQDVIDWCGRTPVRIVPCAK